jgi:starch phosphorylase
VGTWISPPMQALFDRYIPDWKQDNHSLRQAESIPKAEIWNAHLKAKVELIEYVNQSQGAKLEEDVFTIGFARRATAYKRPDLLFHDVERLKKIHREVGRIQLVFAGKAHPSDQDGKRSIQRIVAMKEQLKNDIQIVFVENYDMDIARRIVSGVDLWLNTPQPPLEASGTSGMKAALNGVPSLSIMDGWWIEGLIEGITGWSIEGGKSDSADAERAISSASLYGKLEQQVLPMFYQDREGFIAVMKHSIALNGSFFNTQRMLQQYVLRAYFR